MKGLETLRKKIDKLDREIVALLNERARAAIEIGRIKETGNASCYSPAREREVMDNIKAANAGPLSNAALVNVYREIISASRSLEGPLRIACLGPLATFAHLAALRHFGASSKISPMETVKDVFDEVDSGRADFGVVPIENSNEGIVGNTLDMFINNEYDLKICGEALLEVQQNLLSKKGDISGIKRIYSHPQGIAQCRGWLEKNVPGARLFETSSTARAAEIAAQEEDSAAIASEAAAELYKLKFIAKGIEDRKHNFTRFLVIGKDYPPRTGKDRTSVMLSVKDKPGALHDVLAPFKRSGLNLTKIESRPSKRKAWEYIFFVDMDGHVTDKPVDKALKGIAKACLFVKVLGSYPRVEAD